VLKSGDDMARDKKPLKTLAERLKVSVKRFILFLLQHLAGVMCVRAPGRRLTRKALWCTQEGSAEEDIEEECSSEEEEEEELPPPV